MTSIGSKGGMLDAPKWWPTRQPRAPKPHHMKYGGRWFIVSNSHVTWWSLEPTFRGGARQRF